MVDPQAAATVHRVRCFTGELRQPYPEEECSLMGKYMAAAMCLEQYGVPDKIGIWKREATELLRDNERKKSEWKVRGNQKRNRPSRQNAGASMNTNKMCRSAGLW